MIPFSFIHASDLHLNATFNGLGALSDKVVEKTLVNASFASFSRIVEVAIDAGVDFVLLAGDIFDSANRTPRAQMLFRQQLCRLDEQGIDLFAVHGNHDYLKNDQYLEMPGNLHTFGEGFSHLPAFNSSGENVAEIYGTSFTEREYRQNPLNGFKRDDNAQFAIGLLHSNVGGTCGHDNYAPCTKTELAATGLDYWALGHIHTYTVLSSASPVIVYPGSIFGRNINETGNRGCCHLSVDGAGEVTITRRSTAPVLWFNEEVYPSAALTATPDTGIIEPDINDIIKSLENRVDEIWHQLGDRSGIVRWRLSGEPVLVTSLERLLSGKVFLPDNGIVERVEGAEIGTGDRFLYSYTKIDTSFVNNYSIDTLGLSESILADIFNISDDLLAERGSGKAGAGYSERVLRMEQFLGSFWHNRQVQNLLNDLDLLDNPLDEDSDSSGINLARGLADMRAVVVNSFRQADE